MKPFEQLLASAKAGLVRDLDVSGQDFSFRSLDGAEAECLRATGLLAKGSSWRDCYFDMPSFGEAIFISAVFDGSSMLEPAFTGSDLTNASLRNVVWSSPTMPEVTLDDADATGAVLNGAMFTGSSMKRTCFAGAELEDCS